MSRERSIGRPGLLRLVTKHLCQHRVERVGLNVVHPRMFTVNAASDKTRI
jgi:hypothetical protein